MLDTSFSIVATESPAIVALQSGCSMTDIKRLKAKELHQEMICLGWSDLELQRPDGKKYLKMKEWYRKNWMT